MTNNLNVGMIKYTNTRNEPHGNYLVLPFRKKGLKLIIYVSAAEMESLNQDTNNLVIGIL